MPIQSELDLSEPNEADRQLSIFAWTLAASIGLLLCFVQFGAMASLLARRLGFAEVFPISVAISALAGFLMPRGKNLKISMRWKIVVWFFILLAISLALSAFFFDFSIDGQWYHQSAIIRIGQDWNPLTDPMRHFPRNLDLWDRHYAKGPWYFAATVWATTGHIEWGKAINWLALFACFFAVLGACLDGRLQRTSALAIAIVVAINPVVVSEVNTFMVDAVLISSLVVVCASLFTSLHRSSATVLIAGVAGSIVTINSKFTGLVYLCFALAAAAVWCLVWRRRLFLKFTAATLATLFLGFCVWGYNPYLTNIYYRHQPFYPLLGSAQYPSTEQMNQDGNELYETPKNMVGRTRLVRFFFATFGRPGNQPYSVGKNASLMWPLTAVPGDLYAYKFQETRVAGFGPWFSACLILSVGLGIWVVFTSRRRWLLLLMMLAIVASLSISRHLWWPRFGPQFWLLPILPLAFVFRIDVSGIRLILARVILCLLVVNAVIVAGVRLHWDAASSILLRNQLRQLRDSGISYDLQTLYFADSARVKLNEAGIQVGNVTRNPVPGSGELMSAVYGSRYSIHYRPAAGSAPPQP